jgi:SPP1 family predicted phage head-tail adaptor
VLGKDVINLISVITGENEMGDTIEVVTKKQIFANKLSYRNKAFYQAMANGLKPQFTFEIKEIDYENQPKLEYENVTYRIIDVSPLKNENVGLICEGLVNNGTA